MGKSKKNAESMKNKALKSTKKDESGSNNPLNNYEINLRSFKTFSKSDWLIFGAGFVCLFFSMYLSVPKDQISKQNTKITTVGSFGQAIEVEISDESKQEEDPIYENPPETTKIFTDEELALYSAENSGPTYLAVIGEVYDVSTSSFYQKFGGYEFFTGKDGSRGFATGKPEDAIPTLPLDMTIPSRAGIVSWAAFYGNHKDYEFMGKLEGVYWDSEGKSTKERDDLVSLYFEYLKDSKFEEEITKKYPYCRQKFTEREKNLVEYWCDEGRVEILKRNDIFPTSKLVPRVLYNRSTRRDRCGCVELERAKEDDKTFRSFDNCDKEKQKCATIKL